jgi:phage terminase large subunit
MNAPDLALTVPVSRAFEPLTFPARYKGAYGGRGSGKSHYFAETIIDRCVSEPGTRVVCIREVQKDLRHSAKLLIEDKLDAMGLSERHGFRIQREVIETPGDGVIIFQGMADHTAGSIKSLEGFDVAWVEEAQTLSATSLQLLRPTIRKPGSELWFSWNPRRKVDPVDQMFRGPELPTDAVVVRCNWDQNPWFPAELEQERLDCKRITPDQYPHIWEGEYATVLTGAYYALALAQARREGRVSFVAKDPLMQIKAFWDLGGAGRASNATAIWVAQFIGQRINVLDYYESVGQPLGFHLEWLRSHGYGASVQYVPHDASKADMVTGIRYEDHLRSAGFTVELVPMQIGAERKRIEVANRLFPAIWFNQKTTEAGLDALGWYHERMDESRSTGLGPEKDWASHGADAFGMLCSAYEPPQKIPQNTRAKALARSLV